VNVSKDFEELFACFNAREVRALIVGGYAFAFHAKPRYTKDLDLLLDPTPENARHLLEALADFGFGSLSLEEDDFTQPGRIIQLGHPPSRVDLLTSLKGVSFPEAWERRVEGRFGGQTVFYLGLEELIQNKRMVGRPQDRADVSVLESFAKRKR
jgi:Nucleotidyl transferase of unknown function (DUF2204)